MNYGSAANEPACATLLNAMRCRHARGRAVAGGGLRAASGRQRLRKRPSTPPLA
jgi:hypothetical protein